MLPNMDSASGDPVPEWDAIERRYRRLDIADKVALAAVPVCLITASALAMCMLLAMPFGARPSVEAWATVAAFAGLGVAASIASHLLRARADALLRRHGWLRRPAGERSA